MRFKARKLAKVAMVLGAVAALGGAVMVLWNLVVPDLFAGARALDYWHALGLLALTRILFGGFRGRGHGGWQGARHWQKWQAMTAEEREQFRHKRADCFRQKEERA